MIKLLISFTLLIPSVVFGQAGISASYIRMTPTSLPSACNLGDIRFDLASSTLKFCNSSNTWIASSGSAGSVSPYSILGNNTSAAAPASSIQSLVVGMPSITDSGIAQQFTGSTNSYYQYLEQNTNSGSSASTDFIVSNDQGTANTHYGDFGINSSTFSGVGSLSLAGATYLYSQTGDLSLGTGSANAVHLLANSSSTDALTVTSSNGLMIPAFSTAGVLSNDTSGNITSKTYATLTPLLSTFTTTVNGLVAAPGSVAGNFLGDDGGWHAVSGSGTVTSVSVATANGFGGTVANSTTTPAITLTTGVTGLLKGNGTAVSAAVSGTDYAPPAALTSVATAAGTTTLTSASNQYQVFTGSTTQTVVLPVVTTLTNGTTYTITNLSSGAVTVQTSGANTIQAMSANSQLVITVQNTAGGTGTASWLWSYDVAQGLPTPIAIGGTAKTSVTIAPAASSWAGWDANKNLSAANFIEGYTTTATAAGTTTLVVGSNYQQYFTGTTTQTVQLPVTSTLALGQQYEIVNTSTGVITVNSSGANLVATVQPSSSAIVTCILTSGTTAASWSAVGASGSPLTTKGDIYTYSTVGARQAVPGDNGMIIADSQQSTGWRSASYSNLQVGRPGKNYIQYADFENASTTGWTLGTTGTLINGLPTGTPTFGSGAAGTLSLANETSSPLAGVDSLGYVSSAATTAGNMVASSAYTIDSEDQAKVMTVKFYYSFPSGSANVNASATSSNSYAWAVWDVTNSAWLISQGNFCVSQLSGTGYCVGTFQNAINTASLRFVIYNANATAGAATMYIDDVYVGPQTAPSGPMVTDWVAYTPTLVGFGTPTAVNFYSRRIGGDLQVRGTFTCGTSTGVTASATLGFNGANGVGIIDPNRLTNGVVGTGGSSQASTTYFGSLSVIGIASGNLLEFGAGTSAVGSGSVGLGTGICSSGTTVSFTTQVPITGWATNSSQSSDTDTRVISMQANGTPATAAQNAPIIYPGVVNDVTGGYSTSTGKYTVPVSGYYRVSMVLNAATAASSYFIYDGSTAIITIGYANSSGAVSGSATIKANAGDLIFVGSGNASGTGTIGASNSLSIERLSGPAVVAATESVNARYQFVGATALVNNTTEQLTSTYATYTKIKDTHNAYNTSTGVYTVPVSGTYRASLRVTFINTAATTGGIQSIIIQAGSAATTSQTIQPFAQGGEGASAQITDTFNCLAGDTLLFQTVQTNGVSLAISSTATFNSIAIERVGN